jgi:hypothetical protein
MNSPVPISQRYLFKANESISSSDHQRSVDGSVQPHAGSKTNTTDAPLEDVVRTLMLLRLTALLMIKYRSKGTETKGIKIKLNLCLGQ